MGGAQSAADAQEVTAEKSSADKGEEASIEAAALAEKVRIDTKDTQKTILTSPPLENTEDEARTPAAMVTRSIGPSASSPREKAEEGKAEKLKLIVLERQKADAIARKEFMRANKITKDIKSFKDDKEALLELSRQKADAIANNNFMQANKIMKEIAALTTKKEAVVEVAASELVLAEMDAPKQELADLAPVAKSAADKETREQVSAEKESSESPPLPSDSSTAVVAREFEITTHEVTRRLGRQFEGLFPGRNLGKSPYTIVVLCIKTRNRMSAMSSDMLSERTEYFQLLIDRMQVFRDALQAAGYWCDFIDPSSGAPFHTDSATTFAESDDRVRSLGFEILELGCCRVACSKKYGQCMVMTTAFVDTTADNITEALKLLETDP